MENKENTLVIMELALEEGQRLLFVVDRKKFSHEAFDEKSLSGNFYYYNSGTCPINWLRDVEEVFLIQPDGEIECDPHGLFRFAHQSNVTTTPDELGNCDEFYETIVRQHLREEGEVKQFLEGMENHNMEGEELIKMWENILFSKPHLCLLSKMVFEQEHYFEVRINQDNEYQVYCNSSSFVDDDADEKTLARIRFLLEFNILGACRQ